MIIKSGEEEALETDLFAAATRAPGDSLRGSNHAEPQTNP
jgi:hypothetical protein